MWGAKAKRPEVYGRSPGPDVWSALPQPDDHMSEGSLMRKDHLQHSRQDSGEHSLTDSRAASI